MLTPFPVCQFRSSRPSCDLVRLVNIFSMSSHAQPQAGGSWGPSVSTVAPPLGLASTFSFPLAQPSAGGPWGGSVTTCAPSFGLAAPSLASAQPLAGGPFFGLTQTSAQPLAGGSSGLTFPVHAQSMAGGLWGGASINLCPLSQPCTVLRVRPALSWRASSWPDAHVRPALGWRAFGPDVPRARPVHVWRAMGGASHNLCPLSQPCAVLRIHPALSWRSSSWPDARVCPAHGWRAFGPDDSGADPASGWRGLGWLRVSLVHLLWPLPSFRSPRPADGRRF